MPNKDNKISQILSKIKDILLDLTYALVLINMMLKV